MKKTNHLSNLKYSFIIVIMLVVGAFLYGLSIADPEFKEVTREIQIESAK